MALYSKGFPVMRKKVKTHPALVVRTVTKFRYNKHEGLTLANIGTL